MKGGPETDRPLFLGRHFVSDFYTLDQLRAELERRGCRPHPNPKSVVVPLGECWIHPDGETRIIIPAGLIIPAEVVKYMLDYHDVPEPKPGN